MLALSTGAPIVVACDLRDAGRLALRPAPAAEVPRTGDRRADATAITAEIARAFERAISASPPDWHLFQPGWPEAGDGDVMRVALACPYAWDDPGGVQVHVRELAERLREPRARGRSCWRPCAAPPAEPWVRRGRPAGRHPVQRLERTDRPPTVVAAAWSATRSRRSDPTSSTRTSRPRRRPGCGRRSRRARRWWARSTRGRRARACTTWPRRCSVARRGVWRSGSRSPSGPPPSSARGSAGRSEIIPNGVDVARSPEPRPADLGAGTQAVVRRAGSTSARGSRWRVEAVRRLARPTARGPPPGRRWATGRNATPSTSSPDDLRARVTMLGAVPNAELPPIARSVRPLPRSRRPAGESFGIVLVEAMAAGLPVVASDIPGYDEVVTDEVDGLLVPPRDPDALAAAAARVLDDAELAGRLARPAASAPPTFDWSVVVARRSRTRYRGPCELGPRRYDRHHAAWAGSSSAVVVLVVLWAIVAFNRLGDATATAPTRAGRRSTCSSGGGTT